MSSKTKGKRVGRYRIELGLGGFVFWATSLLCLLGWIFVLGIMVGRGDVPQVLKPFMPTEGTAPPADDAWLPGSQGVAPAEDSVRDPQLLFYEELDSKKDRAAARSQADRGRVSLDPKGTIHAGEPGGAPMEAPASGVGYAVQVASLDTETAAMAMVDRLASKGYRAYFAKADVGGRTYYRVRCGPYQARSEAAEVREDLAARQGLDGFLMQVRL